MPEEYRSGANSNVPDPGPFLAKIVSHLDPSYMGSLEVQLLHEAGNDEDREGQLRTVKYLNPFYGSTHIDFVTEDPDTHNNTQKAYGMWMVPPDIGTIVVCIFIGGDTRKGYWMGCVQNEDINFSMPGYAATQYAVDSSRETDTEKTRVPVTEYNKIIHTEVQSDTTKKLKPEHPSAKNLEKQGLLKDDIRGITTSSARREVPSMVFGISTPGPVDKTGKTGKVGKHEHKINNAFVSRLGGSSFVMDDGDDKFLRKTTPSDGPPEYASLEQGEDGIKDILHNELIRFRTRTGHQILLHNSEDLIYIGNARGTAWIELTSDGKIDIYAEDSINIRTKQDFNFYCERDFNLEVGRNFNTKVHGEMHTNVIKDQVLIVDRDQKIHIKRRRDETIDEQLRQTVNDDVKKYYAKDYTHNVDGRMDFKVANGFSFSGGNGASGAQFGPLDATSQDPADPVSNDADTSSPVAEVSGSTPDRIDIKIYKDMRIQHLAGKSVDHTISGYLKTKINGDVDLHTDGTYEHYTAGNVDIKTAGHLFQQSSGDFEVKAGGHIYNTSGGTNETNAGGNIVETAPQIHMNGPGAASAGGASTAQIAVLPEEARTSAKATIPSNLKTHTLPDLPAQDDWQGLTTQELIMRRMPSPEPYPQHENLDPLKVKPDQTDRDIDGRYKGNSETMKEEASAWRKYSTVTDTFAKVPAANQEE
jgi:hypothetical protein